jgi:uncharacterized protein (TIGR04141 family)
MVMTHAHQRIGSRGCKMAKSRSFSIYLLKNGFDANNSLKKEHSLGNPIKANNLPDGAILYLFDKKPNPPWWKSFWGITQDLQQTLKGSIVFLPVSNRTFVLTFGHTSHFLEENSYEYDFGLRTTLNALNPQKIKSTDILQPESAKRERIQSPVASDLTFFDLNTDESIIKKLTGAVKEEYKDILTNITGANSLRISSKVNAREISTLCSQLLEIYSKDDFKESFPDIQNVIPVKDPDLIYQLNDKIIESFNTESYELVLAIPDIINYSDSFNISFSGAGKSSNIYEDVYIAYYREYLDEKDVLDVSVNILKHHKLNIDDENENNRKSYSIFKCLLFDCELSSEHYHLCEGEWYYIDKNYIQKIKQILDPIFKQHSVLKECNQKREDDYNSSVANSNSNYYCLDKKNIAPDGETSVEPCDLLTIDNNFVNLIHIKISTRSASLSHLFNQGLNSVELLRMQPESKQKLKKLVNNQDIDTFINSDKFAVIFGIITAKNSDKKSDNLPIFSRISLMRTMQFLKLMGISCSVVFIKDNVNRKAVRETSNDH